MKVTKHQLKRIIKEFYGSQDTYTTRAPELAAILAAAEEAHTSKNVSYAELKDFFWQLNSVYANDGKIMEGSTMKITKRQLRKIIKEAMDVVNVETGEVIDFGPESLSGLPDAALPDLVKRLGLDMSPGGQLSNADFQKLEDETLGKQEDREVKRRIAKMKADSARLNIDSLLQRLSDWAEDAARDYMADNPDVDLQDIAYDLADAWEFEFDEDEREELMWHFDGDLNDLKIYAAESMG